ncbi:helix-turn-helix domain-containing protein [Acinetobacter higginsii]|uniref:helix-turn-helix domain-containing protein n=1 Tax=Acinetobacter higginsii TaxID=70347 RepID=UPI00267740EB|nr:helix-turn-helix transcriptional regulator [Acinetobacter higginsii]MDO3665357.1 helix-turn-helix transcriptional regulator [Acinetobacter higginsii]
MAVTELGKAVREARRKTNDTLLTMSEALNKSPAFLSAIETGKTKIPLDFVNSIITFFEAKNYFFPSDLVQLAMVDNENAPLDGLSNQHKMMVAGFANSKFTKDELDKICNLLAEIHNFKGEASDDGKKR